MRRRARIGKKRPLGELSIEILSMRGITPDGKTERAVPSVMFKMGGSWAHLPASARRRAPAWRREIVAAVYDPSDAADIGVFDSADADAPLGFINVPVSRLPRDVPLVSTLALTGGATANPSAEITVRARYISKTSPAAFLLSYFVPPLPRSAYLFANAAGDGKGSGWRNSWRSSESTRKIRSWRDPRRFPRRWWAPCFPAARR